MSDPMTLQQIADYFGVSRERIRQVEITALAKMRRVLASHGIYTYSDISVGEVFQFAADHDIHGDKYK